MSINWSFYLRLCLIVSMILTGSIFSAENESSADPDKLAVIEIIEDQLANAFTIHYPDENPDFGTLDRVFPQWHNNEPAEARRDWTFHGLQTYAVKYVVHTVHAEQPGIMIARGQKTVTLHRLITFWIFPPELKRDQFEVDFEIECRRLSNGDWIIANETNYQIQTVDGGSKTPYLKYLKGVRAPITGRPSISDLK